MAEAEALQEVTITALPPMQIEVATTPEVLPKKTSGVVRQKNLRRKCPLPSLKDIAWEEAKGAGAWECWHCPSRTKERSRKIYLGYVGKKALASWMAMEGRERRVAVELWVAQKREERSIDA